MRSPPAPLTDLTEKQWQAQVIQVARLFGWTVAHFRPAQTSKGWRTPVAADGAGWPDLVLVRERVLYLELKTTRGKLSDTQRDWLTALRAAGQEAYVARPHQLEAVTALLRHRVNTGRHPDADDVEETTQAELDRC